MKRSGIIVILAVSVILLAFTGFYVRWNLASYDKTCFSCHEIKSSVGQWDLSAHGKLACKDCHGTALSSGFHSIKEKGKMVVSHATDNIPEKIRSSESQLLTMMVKCEQCHASEFANWKSSGHSATYAHIFLDEKHNKEEQLVTECIRCHGMFYEGNLDDLVKPHDTKGPWELVDPEIAENPTIPCMTCHKIHIRGSEKSIPDYANPKLTMFNKKKEAGSFALYTRQDNLHMKGENVVLGTIYDGERELLISDDPNQKLCLQCHAPNPLLQSGTHDDRTPSGVHEGLSCLACHDPHSNNPRNACVKCHPKFSHCGLNVELMNTSFLHPESPNNIHSVKCIDCHKDGIPEKANQP